jgi:flagellar hook-associated protein 2
MSDISIPGVSSQYNTEKLIEELMEVERVPLQRLEKQVETYQDQKQVWQGLNRKIAKFRDSAKSLYGFENPFLEKTSQSSDPSVLEVTAGREASEESKSVVVHSVAKADRFLSASLKKDYKVPAGTYRFTVGEDVVEFNYKGGSLRDFAKAIEKHGKGVLTATVVKDTKDTEVILIGGVKTGAENTLGFEKEALTFAKSVGMIKRSSTEGQNITLNIEDTRGLGAPLSEMQVTSQDGGILIGPESEVSIPFNRRINDTKGLVMEIEIGVKEYSSDYTPPTHPPGPSVPREEGVEISDIELKNNPSWVDLPDWEEPTPPKRVDTLGVLHLADGEHAAALPDIAGGQGEQTISVQLSDYLSGASALQIRNTNTHREIEVKGIRVYDPNARGEYEPANPVSTASDAHITVDGIDIYRSENDIDDVIPGITLHVKSPSNRAVSFSVEPDVETIKESIIQFVGYYNQLLTEILILTGQEPPGGTSSRYSSREDSSIIDEIDYFTEEERDAAREKLGLFQGDITLMQMKNRLQRIMMDAHDTGPDSDLRLLAQIGISTNAAGAAGTTGRLRGYLQINEKQLDEAIASSVEGIKKLFGYDSDGDLVVDSGVAYNTEMYTRSYNQSGGIIAMKQQTLDSRISRTSQDIESYSRRLERKEADLKREYGRMESTLEELQKSGEAIENLGGGNSGNR